MGCWPLPLDLLNTLPLAAYNFHLAAYNFPLAAYNLPLAVFPPSSPRRPFLPMSFPFRP